MRITPEGRAAQAERVLVPRGHLPDREEAGERVEAVGQRHGDAHVAVRAGGRPAKRGQ